MLTLATRCHNVCNSMIEIYRPVTEVTAVSESICCVLWMCLHDIFVISLAVTVYTCNLSILY